MNSNQSMISKCGKQIYGIFTPRMILLYSILDKNDQLQNHKACLSK